MLSLIHWFISIAVCRFPLIPFFLTLKIDLLSNLDFLSLRRFLHIFYIIYHYYCCFNLLKFFFAWLKHQHKHSLISQLEEQTHLDLSKQLILFLFNFCKLTLWKHCYVQLTLYRINLVIFYCYSCHVNFVLEISESDKFPPLQDRMKKVLPLPGMI